MQGILWNKSKKTHVLPPSLSRVITWLVPVIQLKTSAWSAVNFQKTHDLDELLTWAPDIVTWYWSADILFWLLSINHNMDIQYQIWSYGNDATLLVFKVWGLQYGRTESHMTTEIFEIDRLPDFLRYGALLACLQHAGALLWSIQ